MTDPSLNAAPLRLLVVEDEFLVASTLEAMLEDQGHVICGIAATAEEACDLATRERPDLVLMDIRLAGGSDGVEAALRIRRELGIASIFATGNTEPGTRQRAAAAEPVGWLAKPYSDEALASALAEARSVLGLR
ncbi:MAG TPA: response regulator [Alphaproteobacteria bacterium]|nr:response regulator [Alphaproteobacteria bacterium]